MKEHRLEESPALSEAFFKTSRFSVLLEIVVKSLRMLKESKYNSGLITTPYHHRQRHCQNDIDDGGDRQ